MDVAAYYHTLLAHRTALLHECIADEPTFAMHVASHNFLKDFNVLLEVIGEPEGCIFT
jgi:hypothetical protein